MYHSSKRLLFPKKFKRLGSLATGVGLCVLLLILSGCSKELSIKSKYLESKLFEVPEIYLVVPNIQCLVDKDQDGIDDLTDIVAGGKAEVQRSPRYRDNYYAGGYPPEDEGVCTDVIWRAFRDAGYNLKEMVDEDIRQNISQYPRVEGVREPNIDFRRVQNLAVFFQRYGQELTTEVIPGDVENLAQWQPGDIVTFAMPLEHIAIISDRRRPDGVPYIIHNGGPVASEEDRLLTWRSPISGHYRFPKFE